MKLIQSAVAVAIASLAALPATATASGFALIDQNGSGLGNAYAGATAAADDASTIFFNPAGMALLHGRQLVLAGSLISPSSKFTDSGSQAAGGGRPLGTLPDGARRTAFVPGGYFMAEINPRLRFGIGINAPFGSKTEYPADWIGRYQAVKSSIETVNVNPSFSWQVNDVLAIGAGLNYQKIKASMSNYTVIVGATDGYTTLEGSDAQWGYNLGAMLKLEDGSRIGLAYRSSLNYTLSGTGYTSCALTVAGVTNTAIPINAAFHTPDTLSVGYFKPLDEKWDVMADVTHTGWSKFKELRVTNATTGATLSLTPENWRNTWRFSAGANRHISEQWLMRMGLAYDIDPVPDGLRTARIPDSDRTMLSLGGQYKRDKDDALDFGYAHVFVKKGGIDKNSGGPANAADTTKYARLFGTYDSSANILSVQYTHNF